MLWGMRNLKLATVATRVFELTEPGSFLSAMSTDCGSDALN